MTRPVPSPDAFSPVADPDVVFETVLSSEIFRRLRGFGEAGTQLAVLTGAPGTGKTTMLRRLMCAFERAGIRAIMEPLPVGADDLRRRLPPLEPGSSVTVGLDEAQALDRHAIASLCALLKERPDVRILLVGQPSLESRLADMEARGMAPPPSVRCRLAPLLPGEVSAYIEYRWRKVNTGRNPFLSPAVERIALLSEGIPQVINLISSRLARLAGAGPHDAISADMVDRAASDLPRNTPSRRVRRAPRPRAARPRLARAMLAAVVIVPVVMVVGDAVLGSRMRESARHEPPPAIESVEREPATTMVASLAPALGGGASASDAETPHDMALAPGLTAARESMARESAVREATVPAREATGPAREVAPAAKRDREPMLPPRPSVARPLLLATRREPPPRDDALLRRAEDGDVAAIRTLLADGASTDARDAAGFTPLMLAVIHGNAAALDALVDGGSAVNAQNRAGLTPLMLAAINGHAAVLRQLVDRGADVNQRTKAGWTALTYAAWRGNAEIVRTLLARGADPNLADREGWTPLRYAAWRAAEPIPSADLPGGGPAADVARVSGSGPAHQEVIALLRQAGARR